MKLSEYIEETTRSAHRPHPGTCPSCPEIGCRLCEEGGVIEITEIECCEGRLELDGPEIWIPCPACRPMSRDAAMQSLSIVEERIAT